MKYRNQVVPTDMAVVVPTTSAVNETDCSSSAVAGDLGVPTVTKPGAYNAELLIRGAVQTNSHQRIGEAAPKSFNLQPNEDTKMLNCKSVVPTADMAVTKPGSGKSDKRVRNMYHDPSCTYICAPEPEPTSPQRRANTLSRVSLRLGTSFGRVVAMVLGLCAGMFTLPAVGQTVVGSAEVAAVYQNTTNATTYWRPNAPNQSERISTSTCVGSATTSTALCTSVGASVYALHLRVNRNNSNAFIRIRSKLVGEADSELSTGGTYFPSTTEYEDLFCENRNGSNVCEIAIAGEADLKMGSNLLIVDNPTVGNSEYSISNTALGGANNPIVLPSTPTNLTLSGNNLSWTQATASHDGFTLYYGASRGIGTGSANTTIAKNDVTCTGTGATQTCTYPIASLPLSTGFFKLAANGSMSLRSALSSREIQLPHVAPTTAPTISKAERTTSGIELAWNKPTNSRGFTIYHGTSSGVTTSNANPITLTLVEAECASDNGCTYTIPYGTTGGATFDFKRHYWFGITADGTNGAASALSTEKQTTINSLRVSITDSSPNSAPTVGDTITGVFVHPTPPTSGPARFNIRLYACTVATNIVAADIANGTKCRQLATMTQSGNVLTSVLTVTYQLATSEVTTPVRYIYSVAGSGFGVGDVWIYDSVAQIVGLPMAVEGPPLMLNPLTDRTYDFGESVASFSLGTVTGGGGTGAKTYTLLQGACTSTSALGSALSDLGLTATASGTATPVSISGTARTSGTETQRRTAQSVTLCYRAMENNVMSGQQDFMITVNGQPVLNFAAPNNLSCTVDVACTHSINAATGGVGAIQNQTLTLSDDSALPQWLTPTAGTGTTAFTIRGTPRASDMGMITLRYKASDSASSVGGGISNQSVDETFTLQIVDLMVGAITCTSNCATPYGVGAEIQAPQNATKQGGTTVAITAYQWQVCASENGAECEPISGAESRTYTVADTDLATSTRYLRVLVTADGVTIPSSNAVALASTTTPPPPAGNGGSAPPPPKSSDSTGTILAIGVIAYLAYVGWKKWQAKKTGGTADLASLPELSFDLDRNDRRAFYTKMNWANAGGSNWQLRSKFNLHTKYSGKLLDWHADSHIGYQLRGKFGEFNPYAKAKFIQDDPDNKPMDETYTLGLNYALADRFAVQFLQPDDEVWRYSLKTQMRLPKGISLQLDQPDSDIWQYSMRTDWQVTDRVKLEFVQPNSDIWRYSANLNWQISERIGLNLSQPNNDLPNYGFGIQWHGDSKIRYGISGETGRNLYRFTGEFSF